jgi:hypothetical protein
VVRAAAGSTAGTGSTCPRRVLSVVLGSAVIGQVLGRLLFVGVLLEGLVGALKSRGRCFRPLERAQEDSPGISVGERGDLR